jgi:nicotinamidase-related amidase
MIVDHSTSALVVVDVQNGFVTEHSRHVVPVIVDLVERWKELGRDIVFTRYINYDNSPFERIIKWSRFKQSPEIDVVDELQPLTASPASIIDKRVYTLFAGKGMELVRHKGWTDLYICGIDTEVCVLKTAVDAFEQNITPWLISDASASHAGSETHEAGLLVAKKMIGAGQIISTADLL